MAVGRTPQDRPRRPTNVRFFNMDEWLGVPSMTQGRYGGDDLDQLDKDMVQDLRRKQRDIRLREMDQYLKKKDAELTAQERALQRAQRTSRMSGGIVPGGLSPISLTPDLMKNMASLPENERAVNLSMLSMLSQMSQGQPGARCRLRPQRLREHHHRGLL
jgi:hypothetical protein